MSEGTTDLQLNCLFDPGEYVAFKQSVFELSTGPAPFFVLNPLKDASSIKADNIASFRNILVEIDCMSLEAQERYIEETIKMPWSTKVFSGKKSYHYIISLETPFKERKIYDQAVSCIYAAVRKNDPTCKNPNRLSRLAGINRLDTNLVQELKAIRGRIPNEVLENWLFVDNAVTTNQALMPKVYMPVTEQPGAPKMQRVTERTLALIEEGRYDVPSRHEALMKAAVNMRAVGFTEEEMRTNLDRAADLIGLAGRGDVDGIIEWTLRHIQPTVVEE